MHDTTHLPPRLKQIAEKELDLSATLKQLKTDLNAFMEGMNQLPTSFKSVEYQSKMKSLLSAALRGLEDYRQIVDDLIDEMTEASDSLHVEIVKIFTSVPLHDESTSSTDASKDTKSIIDSSISSLQKTCQSLAAIRSQYSACEEIVENLDKLESPITARLQSADDLPPV